MWIPLLIGTLLDSAFFFLPLRNSNPVDASAQGFLLQDHNRLCLVSNKDTFSGSLQVLREAVDHVRESVHVYRLEKGEKKKKKSKNRAVGSIQYHLHFKPN